MIPRFSQLTTWNVLHGPRRRSGWMPIDTGLKERRNGRRSRTTASIRIISLLLCTGYQYYSHQLSMKNYTSCLVSVDARRRESIPAFIDVMTNHLHWQSQVPKVQYVLDAIRHAICCSKNNNNNNTNDNDIGLCTYIYKCVCLYHVHVGE